MRVAILPREVAARVITGGIARGAWGISAASLALTIPLLIEFMLARGLGSALPLPLAILVVMLALAITASLRPGTLGVIVFLVVGSVGAVVYELALLSAAPLTIDEGLFVLNRPAVSLVLVGVAGTSWVVGLAWTSAGFLVSLSVTAVVSAVAGMPFRTGWGPIFMLLLYVVSNLVLAGIQASQRRLVPDFQRLEEETHRLDVEEGMRARVTAVMHDTLLNDLSIVMNAPDELDERATARLRRDVSTFRSAEWLRESAEAVAIDEQDSELRNRIMLLVSELQWRGLTVHITGGGSGVYRLDPEVATALVDAVGAGLENVLRHSGVTVAEVDIAYSEDEITVMVTDQGVGFDPAAIAEDRLGVRLSIIERIQSVGGQVRVWSSPGAGASIVIRVPLLETVSPHGESHHAE